MNILKKRIALLFISSFITANAAFADISFTNPDDYTGEAFFTPPALQKNSSAHKSSNVKNKTIPPLKKLRLMIQENSQKREQRNFELAPTAEDVYSAGTETSEYISKEPEDDFEAMPDGFEADEESISESEKPKKRFFKKKSKQEQVDSTEDIILDCDNVDYDTPNYLIHANGNVSVEFVKQGSTVKADTITFDRINNTIKAEGNVRILKSGKVITGDYIFVDMNEENALIENPMMETATIEIKSKKGYVYGDKIVQEDGSLKVDQSYPIELRPPRRGPQMYKMIVPKNDTLAEDMEKGRITLKTKDLKITQKGEHEIVSIKRGRILRGDKVLWKIPSAKIYTNKNHDYFESNVWEVGGTRGLGIYTGPGVVFELPKGSVLKAMPILNYKSGIGIGGMARFSSGTNITQFAYGTAEGDFVGYGKQKLDDNLYLHYGMNEYMPEWFMGRRRPKYGAALVYEKGYSTNNFLVKGQYAAFSHRAEAGFFHDLNKDKHFERIHGNDKATSRFRYMAQASQNLYSYMDEEAQKAFSVGLISQLSASLYGTGDTQVVGRVGPLVHMQYKRWMQDFGYYFSVADDNTPMPVFDAYRYGKQSLYLREYIRLCKYLTLSWFGSITLTNDSPNGKDFQENSFYFSIGPDDVKVNVGYDFIRENLYCTLEMMTDAKGAKVEYDTFEIKQDKKAKKKEEPKKVNSFEPVGEKVLQRAVVEDVKVIEDVL